MKVRTYNQITHICVGVALLSAVMFDSSARFKWLILAVGIGSGVLAAALYFFNLWEPADSAIDDSKSPELRLAKIEWRYPSATSERHVLARMLSTTEGEYAFAGGKYWTVTNPERHLAHLPLLSKSQQEEFSKRIAHALTALYRPEPTLEIEMECVVTRTGNFVFIVRHVNKLKRPRTFPEVYLPSTEAKTSGEWKVGRSPIASGLSALEVSIGDTLSSR